MDNLKDKDFLPLIKAIELVMVAGAAEIIMARAEPERIQEKYDQACRFVKELDIQIPSEELLKAA